MFGIPKKAKQLATVLAVMRDEGWRTLREISTRIGGTPEASISARLRDLRKIGYRVDRRQAADIKKVRVNEYRVRDPWGC